MTGQPVVMNGKDRTMEVIKVAETYAVTAAVAGAGALAGGIGGAGVGAAVGMLVAGPAGAAVGYGICLIAGFLGGGTAAGIGAKKSMNKVFSHA